MDNTPQNIETTNTLLTTTEQSTTNLILADNRPIITDSTVIAQSTSTVNLKPTIDENPWDLLNLASRPSVILTGTWGATPFANATIKLPFDLASAQSYWNTLFRIFNFARFDMNVRIQVNTTRFHTGRLAVTWNPMSTYTIPITGVPLIWRNTQLPHVVLDASMSNIAELTIPYQHYNDIMPLNGGSSATMGDLIISSLTGLQFAAGSSPTANFTVWFWLSNIQMHTPIATHEPYDPPVSGGLLFAKSSFIEQKSMQIAEIGKSAAACIDSAAQTGTGILKLLDVADNPALPITANRTILSNNNLSHGKSPTSNIRLSLDPISGVDQSSSENPSLADEMHISNIIKIPTLAAVVDLNTSNQFNLAATPSTCLEDTNNYYSTFLGYVSQRFRFWRGGIRIKFEFICSNFHTGRFLLSFLPNVTTVPDYTIATLNNFPSMVMDLQEKHSFEFVVPYTSPTPWKVVAPYHSLDPTGLAISTVVGMINFRTLNELTYPTSVSPYCYLWVYISGAEDFEFAVPYVNINTNYFSPTRGLKTPDFYPDPLPPEPTTTTSPTLFAKSFVSSNRMDITPTSNILNNSSSTSTPLNPLFNEDFMHLKNVLARSTLSCYINTEPTERNIYFVLPITPDKLVNSKEPSFPFTPTTDLITYFSEMFIFWRGSLRYNVISDITRVEPVLISSTIDYQSRHINEKVDRSIAVFNFTPNNEPVVYPTFDWMQANPSHLSSGPMQPNVELEAPYYSAYRKLPRRVLPIGAANYPELDTQTVGNLIVQYVGLTFSHRFYIYTSSSPDFQFFTLGATPIVPKTIV